MKVAALSDFHIGARHHSDGFGHPVQRFLGFLDELEALHDRIVLLGDIYQTDHSAWPSEAEARRSLERIRERVPALAERFDRPPFEHVWGNHDVVVGPALGAPERLRFAGRYPALLTHGHQFDPVATQAPWAANLGTWATGRLRAVGLRPVAGWLEQHDVEIKERRFRGSEGPYAQGARELMHAHEASIVVMGHTHVPGITPVGEGVMINTGTCSRGRTMWASIDTEAGTVEVHDGRSVQRHCMDRS